MLGYIQPRELKHRSITVYFKTFPPRKYFFLLYRLDNWVSDTTVTYQGHLRQ